MENTFENTTLRKVRIFKKSVEKLSFWILVVITFFSCKPVEPPAPYQYNAAPAFKWGFADFYGSYYSHYGNPNNTVSLHLFTGNLFLNEESALEGTGQYLIMEDIFSAPSDTLLPAGNYRAAETGEPFTFYAGKKFEDNRESIPSGAFIYYIESDPTKSKIAYVTDGTMKINVSSEGIYDIQCNFTLDGKTELKGTFKNELPHFDRFAVTPASASRHRLKLQSPVN